MDLPSAPLLDFVSGGTPGRHPGRGDRRLLQSLHQRGHFLGVCRAQVRQNLPGETSLPLADKGDELLCSLVFIYVGLWLPLTGITTSFLLLYSLRRPSKVILSWSISISKGRQWGSRRGQYFNPECNKNQAVRNLQTVTSAALQQPWKVPAPFRPFRPRPPVPPLA